MDLNRPAIAFLLPLAALLGLTGSSPAHARPAELWARAPAFGERLLQPARVTLGSARLPGAAIPLQPAARTAGSRPADGAAHRPPLAAVTAVGAGQAGYVHFFILRGPDYATEIQVGIELEDQRIAWAFPGLGATVSPFMESGSIETGDGEFEIWHLYGLRPFADDAAMRRLRGELPARIRPWLAAQTPYCLRDSGRGECLSCIGFVLRALYPARAGGFPELPRELAAAASAGKYTPRELLLHLTGMLQLPDRQARLQRIAAQPLPEALRDELTALVYAMPPQAAVPAPQRRAGNPPRVDGKGRRRL